MIVRRSGDVSMSLVAPEIRPPLRRIDADLTAAFQALEGRLGEANLRPSMRTCVLNVSIRVDTTNFTPPSVGAEFQSWLGLTPHVGNWRAAAFSAIFPATVAASATAYWTVRAEHGPKRPGDAYTSIFKASPTSRYQAITADFPWLWTPDTNLDFGPSESIRLALVRTAGAPTDFKGNLYAQVVLLGTEA